MTVNWNVVLPLCTLIGGLLYKVVSYRQENKKLKLELDRYNDEKGPGVKKELSDLEDFINYFFKSFLVYARMDRSRRIPVLDLNPFILNFSISSYNHLFNILSKKEIDFIRTAHTSMTFISALTKDVFSKIPKDKYNEYIDSIIEDYLLSDKNKEILFNITEKIDKNFDISCCETSLTKEIYALYDEAKIIYTAYKNKSIFN
jgi:hypothetical protein